MIERRNKLFNNDSLWARFYRDGKNLGEICEEFNCGIYDISPWITSSLIRSARMEKNPIFFYRPVGEDGGYEGPIHANSKEFLEIPESHRDQWVPLYSAMLAARDK